MSFSDWLLAQEDVDEMKRTPLVLYCTKCGFEYPEGAAAKPIHCETRMRLKTPHRPSNEQEEGNK